MADSIHYPQLMNISPAPRPWGKLDVIAYFINVYGGRVCLCKKWDK